jgi:F-type H+-transporting ATPase subunit alpha
MILWAVTNGTLDEVPVERVREWEDGFHPFMANSHPEIAETITAEKQLSDETVEKLRAAIDEYKRTIG